MTEPQVQFCRQCKTNLEFGEEIKLKFCPECRFPLVLIAGKYRLEKSLAEGGFGVVYLAHHKDLEQSKRVIKLFKPEIFKNETALARFTREVQVTAMLSENNEHIVRIYDDFGEHPGVGHFYVMEYLQGQTLHQLLRKNRPLDPSLAFHIFLQICKAISAAHKAGIVHRDLKPDNIFLVQRGNDPFFVKVIDFGIARAVDGETQLTKGIIGTPRFMAPEQCLNTPVDERTDIYSLGIILYRMLVGALPFEVDNEEPMSWMMAHIQQTPIPLHLKAPEAGIPEGLNQAVLQALEKKQDHRFLSVELFWQAVEPYASPYQPPSIPAIGASWDGFPAAGLPSGEPSQGASGFQDRRPYETFVKQSQKESMSLEQDSPGPQTELSPPSQAALLAASTSTQAHPPSPSSHSRIWIASTTVLLVGLLVALGWIWKSKETKAPKKEQDPKTSRSEPPLRVERFPIRERAVPKKRSQQSPKKARVIRTNTTLVSKKVGTPLAKSKVPKKPRTHPRKVRRRRIRKPRKRRTFPRVARRRLIRKTGRYRGNLQRSGYFRTRAVYRKPKIKWQFQTGYGAGTTPVMALGKIYVIRYDRRRRPYHSELFAINAHDGSKAWSYGFYRKLIHRTPVIYRKRVFVTHGGGYVATYDAENGQRLGRVHMGRHTHGSVAVMGNYLFMGTDYKIFRAKNLYTGQKAWHFWSTGMNRSIAAFDRNLVFFTTNGDYLYALEHASGRRFWRFKGKSDMQFAPVIQNGMAFCSDAAGYFFGVDIRSGHKKWEFKTGGRITTAAAAAYKMVFFASQDGYLYALRARDGKLVWKKKTVGRTSSAPIIAGGLIYYGGGNKYLYARRAKSGKLVWRFRMKSRLYSSPIIDSGTLYIHAGDGFLYALQ